MNDLYKDNNIELQLLKLCENILQVKCTTMQVHRLLLEPDTEIAVSQIAVLIYKINNKFGFNIRITDFKEEEFTIDNIIKYIKNKYF